MSKTAAKTGLIAALDVGSSKVACLIAHADHNGQIQVLGSGHRQSAGIRQGQVVDMDGAERAIRAVVDAAEQLADHRVDHVLLNLSCGRPTSHRVEVDMTLSDRPVSDADVRGVLEDGRAVGTQDPDMDLIHCIATSFSMDGSSGVRDPRGMYGHRLGVNIHLVTAQTPAVRNLMGVIDRCHLDVDQPVVSPFAAGLSVLTADERDLGATVIDMGAGVTSAAVFTDGHLTGIATVPVGGGHVTSDIAKGLSTPMAAAERLKTVYGSVLAVPADARDMLRVPVVGEGDENAREVAKSMLVQIIQPRVEETFELLREKLAASGHGAASWRRVVLTGGASQMDGLRDFAELAFDCQVRIARPRPLKGLPEAVSGPAFATCTGLLRYGVMDHINMPTAYSARTRKTSAGAFGRIGQWLKENF